MRRGLRTAIAGLFAQLGFASPAVAQRVAMDTMSLHRLPGVFVAVDAVSEEARCDGFSSDSVRKLIADKLADARIKVLGEVEWKVTLGNPVLYVRLNLLRASQYLYIYSVEVEVRQLAVMVRDSQPTFAPTWRSGPSLGTVRASRVSSITGLILNATDRFISAHAVANRGRQRFEFSVRPRLQLPWSAAALRSGISKSKRLRPSTEIRP